MLYMIALLLTVTYANRCGNVIQCCNPSALPLTLRCERSSCDCVRVGTKDFMHYTVGNVAKVYVGSRTKALIEDLRAVIFTPKYSQWIPQYCEDRNILSVFTSGNNNICGEYLL